MKSLLLFLIGTCSFASLETRLAEGLFASGKIEEAKAQYQEVLNTSQDHLEANYGLAKIFFLQEDWLGAFQYLRESLALNRNHKDAPALMQQTLTRLKEYFRTRTASSEQEIVARCQLHFLDKELEKARDQIQKGLRLYPQSGYIWDQKARFHYELNQVEEALNSMRRAMSLRPQSAVIFKHYEMVLYRVEHGVEKSEPPPAKEVSQTLTQSSRPSNNLLVEEGDIQKEPPSDVFNQPLPVRTTEIAEALDTDANDQSFYQKLLNQQLKALPPAPPKTDPAVLAAQQKAAEEAAYVPPAPPSELVQDIEDTERELIQSAEEAWNSKNWEQAAHNYLVLSHNNPQIDLYSQRLSKAQTYQQFEADFLNARREFAINAKNPSQLGGARKLFLELNHELYRDLYQKSDFSYYLGRIAWAQGNYSETATQLQSSLRQDPSDAESGWLLILALDQMGEYEKAYEVLNRLYEYNPDGIGAQSGVSRMRAKLWLWQWRWPIFGFLLLWALLTVSYTSFKSYRLKKSQDRRWQFQLIKNLHADREFKEMVRKIDELLLLELSESEIYNLQYLKANGLFQLGELDQAERQIRSVLGRHKNDSQSLVLLGKIQLSQNKIEIEALPGYRALFQKEPSNLELLKVYVPSLKIAKISGEEFEKAALRLLDLDSYNQGVLQDLVEYYAREQIVDDRAAEVYRQYLELHPGAMSVALQYLACLVDMNNFIEAVKMGKNLVHRNPDLEKAHRLLIRAFDQLSMHEEMKSFYADLSLEYPGSSIVQHMHDLIGSNYRGAGSVLAEELKEEAVDSDVMDAAFKNGVRMLEKGDAKGAAIKLQQAWQDERYSKDAGILLVKAFLQLKDTKSAQLYFEGLNLTQSCMKPEEMEIVYQMAEVYAKMKLKRRALRCYQLIARHDVAFKDVFQRIELLNLEGA